MQAPEYICLNASVTFFSISEDLKLTLQNLYHIQSLDLTMLFTLLGFLSAGGTVIAAGASRRSVA